MGKRFDWNRVREENQRRHQRLSETKGVSGGPPTSSEAEQRAQPVSKRIRRRRAKLAAAMAALLSRQDTLAKASEHAVAAKQHPRELTTEVGRGRRRLRKERKRKRSVWTVSGGLPSLGKRR